MKKIVAINLGDVRGDDWAGSAEKGLEMMRKIREAGFNPTTEAPYLMDGSLLGEGGDVPLLIIVALEGSPSDLLKNVELLKSITAISLPAWAFNALNEDEWDKLRDSE